MARIVPRSGVMQAALNSVESLKELLLIGSSPASNEVWRSTMEFILSEAKGKRRICGACAD
jgi:hypothetical protein